MNLLIKEHPELKFGTMSYRTSTNRIITHHAAGMTSTNNVHDYHKNTNGWAGIGYHYFIDTDGTINEGRPLTAIGAHTEGHNYDSIGICLNGNFEESKPSENQYTSLNWLVNKLNGQFGTLSLHVHKDFNSTLCPGKYFDQSRYLTGVDTNKDDNHTHSILQRAEVKIQQRWLNSEYKTNINVDGYYGNETAKAYCKAIQSEHNRQFNAKLAVDGWYGAKTRASCNARIIEYGASGNITRCLQGLLYCNGFILGIDGKYGSETKSVLNSYQRSKGLTVDGKAGGNTFGALLALVRA